MAVARTVSQSRCLMGRLKLGEDILQTLTDFCEANGIKLGRVEAIGAVSKARLAAYDQTAREYHYYEINKHLELLSLVGNVSLKNGKPIVHAHATFSDEKGNAFGGHLAPGTQAFACEFIIGVFEGPSFNRGYDLDTGLPLWDMPDME